MHKLTVSSNFIKVRVIIKTGDLSGLPSHDPAHRPHSIVGGSTQG